MNKKLISILTVFTLVVSLLPFGALAQDEEDEVIREFVNITFDTGSINKNDYITYETASKNGYGLSVVKDSETDSYVLKHQHKKDSTLSSGSGPQLSAPKSYLRNYNIKGKLFFEYDIKFENFNSYYILGVIEFIKDNKWFSGLRVEPGTGNVSYSGSTVATVELNTWHHFKWIMDVAEDMCIVYMDDTKLIEASLDGNAEQGFKYITLPRANGLNAKNESIFYMDNIKVYDIPEKYTYEIFAIEDGGESENLENFPLSGGELKIKFSDEMQSEITKDDFVFLSDGFAIDFDVTYDKENSEVIITPTNDFKGREKCTLSFDSVKTSLGLGSKIDTNVEFTVAPPVWGIEEIIVPELFPGENTDITAWVKNHTDSSKSGIVLVGFYREGRLISVSTTGVDAPSSTEENTQTELQIFVPDDYSQGNYELRAFLLKSSSMFVVDHVTK